MSQNQGIKDWIYDKMSRYVMFSSHVMPTWACARAGIYACGSAVPCLCLVYAFYVSSMWVLCALYLDRGFSVICWFWLSLRCLSTDQCCRVHSLGLL